MELYGVKSVYSKKTIESDVFIRMEQHDLEVGIISVGIYLRQGTRYQVLLPVDLPDSVLSELEEKNGYEELSQEEVTAFEDALNSMHASVEDATVMAEGVEMFIGQALGATYQAVKQPIGRDFYSLVILCSNAYGVPKYQRPIVSSEVPYIVMNLHQSGQIETSKTFQLAKSIYLSVEVRDEHTLIILILEHTVESETIGKLRVLESYTIKRFGEYYTQVRESDSPYFESLTSELLMEMIESFMGRMGMVEQSPGDELESSTS